MSSAKDSEESGRKISTDVHTSIVNNLKCSPMKTPIEVVLDLNKLLEKLRIQNIIAKRADPKHVTEVT